MLEQEQWAQAAGVLMSQEKEVVAWLRKEEEERRVGKEGQQGKREDNGGTTTTTTAAELVLRQPAELLEADAGIKALKKRRHCLTRLCADAEEAMGQRGRGGGWEEGVEGGYDSHEERRRKLLHLIEEASVLYFGGGGGGGTGINEPPSGADSASSPSLLVTRESSSSSSSSSSSFSSSPPPPPPFSSSTTTTPSQRQQQQQQQDTEILQLRMHLEREFMYLMEDQRYREGRLLDRWLALIQAAASQSNTAAAAAAYRKQYPHQQQQQQQQQQRTMSRSRSALSLSSTTTATTSTYPTSSNISNYTNSSNNSSSSSSSSSNMADLPVYTPRCIIAFINYFIFNSLLLPYSLPTSLRPALAGLVQSLISRKARRVVSGYIKGWDVLLFSLNQHWREQVRKARILPPSVLGVPDSYLSSLEEEGRREGGKEGGGVFLGGTARALSRMGFMVTPLEMSDALLAAVRCLHQEAAAAAAAATAAATAAARARRGREGGKGRVLTQEHSLPADVLFPLLVYALVQADCPDVFSCLYVLRHFASGVENVGEKAYYITTLEAAVAHVFYKEEEEEGGKKGGRDGEEKEEGGKEGREGEGRRDGEEGEEEQVSLEELGPCFTVGEQQRGLAYLDEWLAAESAMEETMDILEQDGWF